jgi:hypothetical protein
MLVVAKWVDYLLHELLLSEFTTFFVTGLLKLVGFFLPFSLSPYINKKTKKEDIFNVNIDI